MDSSEVNVRQALFTDVRSIYNIIRGNTDMLVPRSMSFVVQHIDRFLVAETKGEVIGTISYEFLPEIGDPDRTSVELQSLCVKSEWRNHGVGKLLVAKQIERILPLGPFQIVVLTFAEKFFASLGFHVVPKESMMHKLYVGCINCTKHESPFTCPEVAMVMPLNKVLGARG